MNEFIKDIITLIPHILCSACVDNISLIQHGDPVGDFLNAFDVMADDERTDFEFLIQLRYQTVDHV